MKPRILLLCVLLLPILATAEIYKWRDTNGVIRYSDVPPPSNIKQESMSGKKLVTPTGQAPLAEVEGDATVAINKLKAADEKAKADGLKKAPPTKEEAAAKRAKEAEENKKVEAQKKAELEIKQENCKNAKSRLATYTNGGRITKTDENGQKVFLGDVDIAKGRVDAQSDVDTHCN
jgi:hypothetical protein